MQTTSACILIVDDNIDSCDMLSIMLRQSDDSYQITTAQTAEKALGLINTQSFELYILDYLLPEITGIELCSHIRKNEPETPVIILSAMARPADIEAGMAAGADEYLVKPNDLLKITDAVKRLLGNKDYSSKTRLFTSPKNSL